MSPTPFFVTFFVVNHADPDSDHGRLADTFARQLDETARRHLTQNLKNGKFTTFVADPLMTVRLTLNRLRHAIGLQREASPPILYQSFGLQWLQEEDDNEFRALGVRIETVEREVLGAVRVSHLLERWKIMGQARGRMQEALIGVARQLWMQGPSQDHSVLVLSGSPLAESATLDPMHTPLLKPGQAMFYQVEIRDDPWSAHLISSRVLT